MAAMQSKKGREEREGWRGRGEGMKAEEARGEGKEGCRGSAGQGMAWQARPMACHGMAWQDRAVAWHGRAGLGRTGQASDRTGQGRAGEASGITVCLGSLHKTEITKQNKKWSRNGYAH